MKQATSSRWIRASWSSTPSGASAPSDSMSSQVTTSASWSWSNSGGVMANMKWQVWESVTAGSTRWARAGVETMAAMAPLSVMM